MSTKDSPSLGLSSVKFSNPSDTRIGIVVSKWNRKITDNLLKGAKDQLMASGLNSDHVIIKEVPGSFELPLGAQWMLEQLKLDAVICLGSVIKGETDHFTFVCNAASQGIKDVSLKYDKPVIFGVLTDDNLQQAIDRSGGKLGNKGMEAAITAVEMVNLKFQL